MEGRSQAELEELAAGLRYNARKAPLAGFGMKYLRFQLHITPGPGTEYAVHARTPRGEGRARFELPCSRRLVSVRPAVAETRRDVQTVGAPSGSSPEGVGERLFQALFAGEILRLYERSVDLLAIDPEAGLRLELTWDPRDGKLAALQALPWELLRQTDTPGFLALDRRTPVTRFLALPRPVYPPTRPGILRILAVASSASGSHLPPLDLARELDNLRQAVGSAAEVVVPRAATLAAVRQELNARECHVLHFMGHGGVAVAQGHGMLFFASDDGGMAAVRGMDLMNKLGDSPTLRLVVLNACNTASVAPAGAAETDLHALAGVATALVLGGMAAVIAMQAPIADGLAIAFSRALYGEIAAGRPVEAAVTEGRQAIHSMHPGGGEWATPVLFLREQTGDAYAGSSVRDAAARPPRRRWPAPIAIALLCAGGAVGMARSWWLERTVSQGAALFEHGQWGASRERFLAALRLAPGSPEVLSDLAGAEEKLGDVRAAEAHYRMAVQRQPDAAEHLYNLGHFLVDHGSYDEAYRVLLQAVASDPRRADAFGELAQAAAGRGMIGRARVSLRIALRLDPERPAFYRRLGKLELDDERPRAALPYLEHARRDYAAGDLGRVETTWLLAEAYDRLGDVASTCREVGELRLLDPPGITPWAPEALAVAARRGCAAGRRG